jgi:PAS domain S-box-containing protein
MKKLNKFLKSIENIIQLKPDELFNHIASAIVIIDLHGTINYVNKYIEEISQYKTDELIGKNFTNIVTPESRKKVLEVFKRLKQGKDMKPYELSFLDNDGKKIYVKASATAIKHNNEIVSILVCATDITENKKNVEHLSKMVKELSLLYDIGKELTSTINIDLLFSKILLYLSATFGYERTGILIIDESSNILIVKATTKPFRNWQQYKIKLGEGVTGHVAETGEPYLANDVSKETRYIGFDKKTKSEIAVPLKLSTKVIGVINVESYKKNAFDKDDVRILTLIANQAAIAIENSQLYKSLEESYLDTIKTLVSAMEAKDRYTRGHSERVRRYALKIARKLNLNEIQTKELDYAGYLHDIGKIGIKDNLLTKAEPLTDEEYRSIQRHPQIGNNILKDIKHLAATCAIIRSEHERYDGNGYPNGLQKEEIPIGARIIAVADAYDAMTTDRPYHNAISKHEAIKILKKESGKQFDPEVVEAFLKTIK